MFHNKLFVVAGVLAALGAINWGLVAGLNFNLVEYVGALIKHQEEFAKVAYIVIGLCGAYVLVEMLRCCSHCEVKK